MSGAPPTRAATCGSSTVKRVDDDLARYHPNTATAAMMELINTMAEQGAGILSRWNERYGADSQP